MRRSQKEPSKITTPERCDRVFALDDVNEEEFEGAVRRPFSSSSATLSLLSGVFCEQFFAELEASQLTGAFGNAETGQRMQNLVGKPYMSTLPDQIFASVTQRQCRSISSILLQTLTCVHATVSTVTQ